MPNPNTQRDTADHATQPDAATTTVTPTAEQRARRKQRRQARKAAQATGANPANATSERARNRRHDGEPALCALTGAPTRVPGEAQRSETPDDQERIPSLVKRLYRDVSKPNRRVALGQASHDPSRPKVCYLHIGMHKTGTTSVQSTLAGIGARDHWRYVHAGTPNGSLGVNTAFKAEDPLSGWQFRHEDKTSDMARNVRARVRSSFAHFLQQPANTYLLSAESMSKFTEAEVREALDWFRPHVDRVVVVGYLRPVRGFMQSMAQQSVKGRGMANRLTSVVLDECYPAYRDRFEPWEANVAKEDLVLRLFDRRTLVGGDVVLDLAHTAGIELRASEVLRSNESFTLDALKLYELFANHGAANLTREARASVQRLLLVALKSAGGERMQMASATVDAVAGKHLDDIAWAEERLGKGTLYTPNDAAGALGLTSLSLDMTQPATPPMVSWFNDMLGKVCDARLPAQPTQRQLARAVQEIIARVRELQRLFDQDQLEDDDAV